MKFRDLFLHLREMKHYFIVSLLTFALGIYLGSMESGSFAAYLQGQSEQLSGMLEGIKRLEPLQLWLFAFIFANNVLVSILMVYAGTFFGFIPLFALLSNGLLVGYLARRAWEEGEVGTFIIGVAPHGIIEIPAFLLACAYGIRLGTLAAKGVLFLPFPTRRASNGKQFLRVLKLTLPLALVLAALLLTAAFIESFVTYAIVQ